MATRLSRSADNQLVEQLTSLRTDVDGLKTLQRVGGANVVGYLSATTANYDATVTLAAGAAASYLITFLGLSSLFACIADLYLDYSLNPAVLANAIPPYANGAVVSIKMQELPLSGQTSQWHATFTNVSGSSQTIYIKSVFNGSSLGYTSITSI